MVLGSTSSRTGRSAVAVYPVGVLVIVDGAASLGRVFVLVRGGTQQGSHRAWVQHSGGFASSGCLLPGPLRGRGCAASSRRLSVSTTQEGDSIRPILLGCTQHALGSPWIQD